MQHIQFNKYFNSKEFDSPDLPYSGTTMSPLLIKKLEFARIRSNLPFFITSGFRTKTYNAKIKGKPNSAHLLGMAVDIECTSSNQRFLIIEALIAAGFTRIGIAKDFIHADVSTSHTDIVIWLY